MFKRSDKVRKSVILLGVFLCVLGPTSLSYASASDIALESQLSQIYKKAEDATVKGDILQSDFWMARYMGLTELNKMTKRAPRDLLPLFKKRADLEPKAFISGKYDEDFIDFFVRAVRTLWRGAEKGVAMGKRQFIVQAFKDEHYFVEILASPELEEWAILKKPSVVAVLPLGSNLEIFSGLIKNGSPIKHFNKVAFNIGEGSIYIWPVEMHDLDGDGTPEIWIRYMKAWADGFSQELAIYKIKDNSELVLLKEFSGEAEGVARRLDGNKIEVGTGFTDNAVGHLGFDQTHLEEWEYKNGKFLKTSEKDVPHILWSKNWYNYYNVDY
jgi:hypothetical protein